MCTVVTRQPLVPAGEVIHTFADWHAGGRAFLSSSRFSMTTSLTYALARRHLSHTEAVSVPNPPTPIYTHAYYINLCKMAAHSTPTQTKSSLTDLLAAILLAVLLIVRCECVQCMYIVCIN